MCVTERERRGKVNLLFLFIHNILYGHKDVNKSFTFPLLSLSHTHSLSPPPSIIESVDSISRDGPDCPYKE